ncbi:MAG: CCA tRNA nucleotidyltransferase [Candidatus Izimaplasma sp.]|nr:CCA tRNA nucleotidyltransferase [Candidatus Izimaplasma bacterium]
MERLVKYGKQIIKKLISLDYEAYFVGGFVRDSLLDIPCNDIDIATNALPSEVEKIFSKTKATGKKYGTISVFIEGYQYEVTTFRIDQKYINNRHPETVDFSNNLKEDLIRRDFTINALAQDIDDKIIDLFNGREDLKNQMIRAIDDPDKRFKEDAIRILRAIRFVGKLDFDIEANTLKAMKDNLQLLKNVATERIISEFKIILNQKYINRVYELLTDIRLAEVFTELENAVKYLKNYNNNINIYQLFAISLYPSRHLNASYWRFSNDEIRHINALVELMEILNKQRLNSIIIYNYHTEYILEADELLKVFFDYESQKAKILNLEKNLVIRSIRDLEVNGNDIKRFTNNNRMIGVVLEKLIEKVLLEQIPNKRDFLLTYSKELVDKLHDKQ